MGLGFLQAFIQDGERLRAESLPDLLMRLLNDAAEEFEDFPTLRHFHHAPASFLDFVPFEQCPLFAVALEGWTRTGGQ